MKPGKNNGGNGGFVETSGKINLQMSGLVDAAAPHGIAGTWLMDPADVTINGSADTGVSSGPTYTPGGGTAEANILASEIVTSLNAGTNVTITTGGDG